MVSQCGNYIVKISYEIACNSERSASLSLRFKIGCLLKSCA